MANYLSIDEAVAKLHCTKSYLYKLTHQRKLPFYKPFGGKILFDAEELETFIRSRRVSTRAELEDRAVELLNRGGSK